MRLAALTGLYVAVVCTAQVGANKIVGGDVLLHQLSISDVDDRSTRSPRHLTRPPRGAQ